MLEAISIGVLSNTVFDGLKYGVPKARVLLTQEEYEQEADAITVAITTALKESVVPALVSDTGMTEAQLGEAWDWTAIAAELDALEVWSQDRQTAIAHLTDAIEAGLGLEFEVDSTRRTTLEAAVAVGYKHAVRQFVEEIAGTPLADELELLTDRELLAIVDTIEERLTALEQELRGKRAELRNGGVVRLDPLYFERHDPGDPETTWRTGFTLADVAAGYPLSRERPASAANERASLTDEVYDQLTAGDHVVVVGEAGSGKSTVCKQVACRWHTDTDQGAVLYRPSARSTLDKPGTLIETIHAAEHTLLVVVEDAPRKDANTIFEVLAELSQSDEVAVLLDARTGTWDSDRPIGGHTRLDHQRRHLSRIDMPSLDEQECHRAIDHYREITGKKLTRTGEQVFEKVRAAEIGGLLVMAYQLTGPAPDTDRPVSAFHDHVRQTYTTIEEWADGEALLETVAVMINVLNAADLPVEDAFVHALADNRAEHQRIEHTIDFLEGAMFEQTAGNRQMPHPLWSVLYLKQMLEVAGERLARDRFEQCVEALFRLVDQETCRKQVCDWFRGQPEVFTPLIETPEAAGCRFVRRIADIARTRPAIGVLYGIPETWRIRLPAHCHVGGKLQWFATRGNIHFDRGALNAAQAEFDRLHELLESTKKRQSDPKISRAWVLDNLGKVANKRGDLESAEMYHEEALALTQEVGDHHGEASSLTHLGILTETRGDLATAEAYHEEALTLYQEVSDRHGEAVSLSNLGTIAEDRGDLKAAEAYHEEALTLYREVGDRHGEAKCLANFGKVARMREDLESAEAYLEEALPFFREVGDRRSEASGLNSLGNVAKDRGDLATAEAYHKESLAVERERGNRHGEAVSLSNLGTIAEDRGDLEGAEKYYEETLPLYRERSDRYSEAMNLTNLGKVARMRGDLKAAEAYHEEALDLEREVGDHHSEAVSLTTLGNVTRDQGDLGAAEDYYEEALTLYRGVDDCHCESKCLTNLGIIACIRGDLKAAEAYHEEALTLYQGVGDRHGEAASLSNLGTIAEDRGDLKAAEKYYAEALTLYQEEGDRHGEAVNLYSLGVIAHDCERLVVAEEYLAEAIGVLCTNELTSVTFDGFVELIDVCEQRGATATAVEWCDEAIAFAEQTEHKTEREQFQDRRSELLNTDE